jgi:hypothetical protein
MHTKPLCLKRRLNAQFMNRLNQYTDVVSQHLDSTSLSCPMSLLRRTASPNLAFIMYHLQSGWFDEGPQKGPTKQ